MAPPVLETSHTLLLSTLVNSNSDPSRRSLEDNLIQDPHSSSSRTMHEIPAVRLQMEQDEHTVPMSQYKTDLFELLNGSEFDNFLQYLRKLPLLTEAQMTKLLDENDGENTFLQKACSLPQADNVVEVLLQKGVDPNSTNREGNASPPLVIAAVQGNYGVMNKLLDVAAANVNVNLKDINGNTALHVVAKSNNLEMAAKLLKKGAQLEIKNNLGQFPVSTAVMKSLMDMSVEDETDNEDEYRFKLSFGPFIQRHPASVPIAAGPDMRMYTEDNSLYTGDEARNLSADFSESAMLCYITKTHRDEKILKHPLVTTFINLKWWRVLPFFWFNLVWVLLFTVFLNVVLMMECHKSGQCTDVVFTSLIGLTVIFWLGIFLREALQIVPNVRNYMDNKENYLDMAVIVSSAWSICSMFVDWPREDVRLIFSMLTALLSWLKLFVVSGKLPTFSEYMELFTTVTKNFLCFLLWYSTLLMAFSECFYLALRTTDQSFSTVWLSMFKVYTMMIGNIETDSISSSPVPGATYVLFVVFMLIICIVVYSGISGAVSGVEGVRETAAILSVQSQVRLIMIIEQSLIRTYKLRIPLVSRFLTRERFMIFPKGYGDDIYTVYILPNNNTHATVGGRRINGKMDPNVFSRADKILKARAASSATHSGSSSGQFT